MTAQLMTFACCMSASQAGCFFWIGPNSDMAEVQLNGLPLSQLDRYARIQEYDPLNVSALRVNRQRIAVLHDQIVHPTYRRFLHTSRIVDSINLIFCHDHEPVAGLVLMRSTGHPLFTLNGFDWEAMRAHFESTLRLHWRMRTACSEQRCIEKFGFSRRELQVLKLILVGRSNSEIGSLLGLSVATVKNHIVSMFNKTGAESRLMLARMIDRL